MPKLKNYGPGKRVNIWLPERQLDTAEQIENFSNFVQIAVDNAADIMAWALLKQADPKQYNTGTEFNEVIDDFNKKYPLDPLTKKRLRKNGSRIIASDQNAGEEQNPALL